MIPAVMTSPATFQLGTLPYGYYWLRDASGNVLGRVKVTGTDEEGYVHTSYYNITINGVPPNTTSGSLTHNETWGDQNILTGSVDVPSGDTLKILPGSTVEFPSSASLTVNGVLIANGIYVNRITFTSTGSTSPGSWGSIVLSGSGASGSTIQYANIQYGTEVDVINASNVTIRNSSITNSSMNGINFSGSTGSALNNTISNSDIYHGIIVQNGSNVTCNQNVIYKTNQNQQGAGILFSGGNGNVWQNDVDYYNWGIAAIWGSSPQFSNANNNNKNNCITNCQIGVMVYQQSYPTICPGAGAPYSYYMGNSIHNNSINVALNTWYSTVSSLSAEYVYWGGTPVSSMFAVGSGSSIDYNNWLSTDPWSGAPLLLASPAPGGSGVKTNQVAARVTAPQSDAQSPRITTNGSVGANMSNSEDSLLVGIQLREQDKYKEAKDYFVSFLRRHPDQQAAYVELYNCADSATIQDIINFFKSLPTQASNVQDLLLSYLYLKEGEVNSARDVNDEIISKNANTSLAVRAELNNFFIELYNENDPTSASSILKHLQTEANLSTPMELSLAEDALMTYVDPKTGKMPYGSYQQSAVSGQQKTNGLAQNYPNPFNPTTVISYNLRTSGRVTLKVYDVLGREVMTLVDGYQDAGVHTAEFNGENLASGVYFYRLTAPGVNQINKMLMIK